MALCSQKVYGIWVWCYLLVVAYRELWLHNMLVVHGRDNIATTTLGLAASCIKGRVA